MKKKSKDAGTLMVEAAIILPIFILAILTLSYLMKGLYIQETVHALAIDQARKLSVETAIIGGEGTSLTYGMGLNQRIKAKDSQTDFYVSSTVWKNKEDYFIHLDYQIPIAFPMTFSAGLHINEQIIIRSWSGKTNPETPLPFAQMEQEESSEQVVVFPRAGEKYHRSECGYVTVYALEKVLTDRLRTQYHPCQLCNAKTLKNGSVVYCFEKTGKTYHNAVCTSVHRYVVEMAIADAKQAGYSQCSKCF